MSAQHSAKKQRVEELTQHFMRTRGSRRGDARYRAKRRYEVETSSPSIMAWIGGIGTAVTSWGVVPVALWTWERLLDCPGHARHVLRITGWFFTSLAFAFVAIGFGVTADEDDAVGMIMMLVAMGLIGVIGYVDLRPRGRNSRER